MSSGNVPNFLKANVGPESSFQFDHDPKSSAFVKAGYYTTCVHIDARYLYQPTTQYTDYANQTAVIEIARDHDFAGDCELQIPSQPVVIGGTTHTYLRRADWFGFSVIKEFSIKHNTHTLQEWVGDCMLPHYLMESCQEYRNNMDALIGGNLTEAQRDQMAGTSAVFRVPLDIWPWWTKNSHTYMNTQSYSDTIKIYVKFHDKSEFIQTDSTTNQPVAVLGTVVIRNQTYDLGMIIQTHHVTEAERVHHHGHQLNVGVLEPFVDYISVGQQTVKSNQDNFFRVDLKNLNMPLRHLVFTVRRKSDLTTAYQKNQYKWLKITGFGMIAQSNGGEFVPFKSDKYARTREHDQYHSSHTDMRYPLYFHSWSFTPEDHINELGSLHFGNINNPQLTIYIGTAVHDSEARDVSRGDYPASLGPEELVIDIYAQTFNLRQEFGGTPKRTFS